VESSIRARDAKTKEGTAAQKEKKTWALLSQREWFPNQSKIVE